MPKILPLVLTVLLAAFIGCSKKSDGPTASGNGAAITIPTVTFNGPNTTSTDPNATLTKAYASSINGVMAASSVFAQMPVQQNGNTSTWTYGGGGMSYTFTGVKQSDGSYTWSFTFTGTDAGINYTNFTMWQGTTSADGKNGSWTFFEPGHTGKTEDYTYSTDASGVLTGTWYIYNSNGTLGEKIVIVNNPDTSGRVEDYSNGTVMSYKSVWAANGSGTWYTYNSTSGVQSGTGTWH